MLRGSWTHLACGLLSKSAPPSSPSVIGAQRLAGLVIAMLLSSSIRKQPLRSSTSVGNTILAASSVGMGVSVGHAISEKHRQMNQEKLGRLERTIDRQGTIRLVLILCGAAPFFFFLSTSWARAVLLAYIPTALFFGLLLVPDYPPLGTSWFWKAMIPIVVVHSGIVFGLVWLNLNMPAMNKMPRVLYGFVGVILMIEWRLSLRIISTCQPK